MSEIRDALLRMIRAWQQTNRMLDAFIAAGLESKSLTVARDQIGEAVSIIIGEKDADWEDSVTYTALSAPILSEERRLKMLMAKMEESYRMPGPHFFDREKMAESVKKNGGYLFDHEKGVRV